MENLSVYLLQVYIKSKRDEGRKREKLNKKASKSCNG